MTNRSKPQKQLLSALTASEQVLLNKSILLLGFIGKKAIRNDGKPNK